MNTNEPKDGATARPWSVNRKIKRYVDAGINGDGLTTICDCDPIDEVRPEVANANAALIVQAVNEREALLAVAEAAEQWRDQHKASVQMIDALLALAALRASPDKPCNCDACQQGDGH